MRLWAFVLLSGCAGETAGELLARGSAPTQVLEAEKDSGVVDSGVVADAGVVAVDSGFVVDSGVPDAGCLPELPLVVTVGALGPTRLYAYAQLNGQDVALLVDTGSQHTFLSTDGGPDGRPAGAIGLGCEQRQVIGRPYHVDEAVAAGRPVVGTLGADWFLERQRELDLPARVIRTTSTPVPQGWERLAFDDIVGYLFVRVRLDSVDVRLGFDTGAAHTLWLRQQGQAGDQPVSTQDAYGNPLTLWLGTATLIAPMTPARSISVLRAPSFPSLEDANRQLGVGDIHGLFGLSAMGNRKLRIDAASSSIWFGPP